MDPATAALSKRARSALFLPLVVELLAATSEGPPDSVQLVGDRSPPRPLPALLADDEAGIGQDPRVVRDGRLALAEGASRLQLQTSPSDATSDSGAVGQDH